MKLIKLILNVFVFLLVKITIKFQNNYSKAMAKEKFKKVSVKDMKKLKLEGDGTIHEPVNLTIGTDVFLGSNFFIRAAGGVTIGDYTHISRNVVIHTVNHNINGSLLPYDRTDILNSVVIGKYVWIGMNVSILPGVTIGDGAVIGMGTVVSKDVNSGEIVVGSSNRVVGKRDEAETLDKVLKEQYLKF